MEIFIAKADRYVQIASHLHACRLTIENAKYCESPKLPPDNELVKKIAEETIFPRCLNYLRKQRVSSKRFLSLLTDIEKIQSLQINNLNSFKILEEFAIKLSIKYMNYANSDELKELYNEVETSKEDIEIFEEQLSKNEFIALTHNADVFGKELETKYEQMEGYWTSMLERKKASRPGWQARSQKKQEKLRKLKKMFEQKGKLNDSDYIVSRSEWETEFEKIFGYNYVSDKTKATYKKELEQKFTSLHNKKIKIVLRK